MNLKDFKSGTFRQEYQYKSFIPNTINHTFTWDDPQINTMLESATRALGELNAFTMIVPNVDIFIQMHITKEANKSSKIEGTKTEMDEVLISKDQIDPEKRDDWQEVRNYVDAMKPQQAQEHPAIAYLRANDTPENRAIFIKRYKKLPEGM